MLILAKENIDLSFVLLVNEDMSQCKLQVSPFSNERQVGEYLRGSNIVFYSKQQSNKYRI